jgi:hypothetical protein
MPKCTDETIEFGRVGRRVVEAAFDGGDIVSDGGVLLLKQLDERLGLTRAAARALGDERRSASVQHSVHSLLAQRIYGLCLGWSDVCDHNVLRNDLVMQTAVGRAEPLASAATFSRLETGATPEHAAALHEVLMQQFIASHTEAPKELVLDVDATHVPLHGDQERGHFHAYCDNYCYLPLYVFAGQDMLACVLRPSDRDPASVVSALVKRLLVPLRRAWPKTRIIVRADSGRVIARLEHGEQGANPRFIVTDLPGSARALYERRYCARGEAENRIKEAQLDLFGRRASCHRFQANQLRLLLAALAYTLMINLRRLGLHGTELAQACTATIRTRLLKIGAAIVRNTRRVRVLLASAHPMKHVFITAARALAP